MSADVALMMRTIPLFFCASVLSAGCYLNSTFQTAETLMPGTARTGAAVTLVGSPLSMPSRIGVVQNFDVGFRYGFIDHFLIDGKYLFLQDPFDASISLGFSYNTVNAGDNETENRQVSKGFFPTILIGNTGEEVGWYGALRAMYLSQAGREEFIISHRTLFSDSGWIAMGFSLGGFIHGGSSFRFMTELSMFFGRNGRRAIFPTIGFQMDLTD